MTEGSLITSAAAGDVGALEQLIRETAHRVYEYLAGMLGDEREAEDAMQETFVRVARGVERYEPSTDADAWIFGIARRVARDIRPTPSAPPGETPPADGDAGEWAKRSLRALPLELREVIVLKELLHWKPERIAAVLGIKVDDLAERIMSAHAQLAAGMREAARD
ncbi:MAG: sigma-70 family RNA polymerase sigma factor [Actinomycetota bacterium]